MKRMLACVLLICLTAAFLCGCGGSAPTGNSDPAGQSAGADGKTPLSQERFEQIARDLGYEPMRIPEDDLDDFSVCDAEEHIFTPAAVSGMEAPGLECVYVRFSDENGAAALVTETLRDLDEDMQIRRESGGNWERVAAQNSDYESWRLLRVDNTVLFLNTWSDGETLQAGEKLFAALEAG